MAKYDIPSEIDYVLKVTGVRKIKYIGFSMGTTLFWTMTSIQPEYNEKVELMIALAPVVYINNMMGFPKLVAPFQRILKGFMDLIGNGEFLPPWLQNLYNGLGTAFCSNTFISESICANINFLYAGWDLPQLQVKLIPIFYSHTPSPTSSRTIAHIIQMINTGVYAEYDFGYRKNVMVYGKPYPPKYSLNTTTVPVALIWGPNDAVVSPFDVMRLASELPNVVLNEPVNFTLWNHFDYHLGRDVDQLVNDNVMRIMSTF